MFLNRAHDLALLQRWWEDGSAHLITVYGRRQVGKTELLVHFFQAKRCIYFYADRQPLPDQLRAFTQQVLALADDPVLRAQPFTSWDAAFLYVLRLAEQERLGLVLDEFSYAVDSDPALPSIIQRLWDSARRTSSKAFLVLCTSFTEAVERHFRDDGPLYRRRTHELRVEPFNYRDATLFFPAWPQIERALAWGCVGGVPSYLNALHGATLGEAVREDILDKAAILYREAEVLLSQEVRGVGRVTLHGMLQAIANGCTESNQIAQRIGRPVTAISGALGFLVDYGLVQRRVPFTVNPERTRQTRYYLADNYLSFWFRYVLPNRSALEQGQKGYVWDAKIEPTLDQYFGPRFEELSRQFIRLEPARWRHPVPELSVWWNAHDELEIVGHDAGTVLLVAEAKWTKKPIDLDVLRTLERRVALLPRVAPDRQLVLFARGSFTPAVAALSSPDLILIGLDDLLPAPHAHVAGG
jgi:hypothetical protein